MNHNNAITPPSQSKVAKDWLQRLLEPASLLPQINIGEPHRSEAIWWVSAVPINAMRAPRCQIFQALQKRAATDDGESWCAHEPDGTPVAWLLRPQVHDTFSRLTQARTSLEALLKHEPQHITLMLVDSDAAETAGKHTEEEVWAWLYVLLINTVELPHWQKKAPKRCTAINVCWVNEAGEALPKRVQQKRYQACIIAKRNLPALVAGQALCQALTLLPANVLHPKSYRHFVQAFAKRHGFNHESWDAAALEKLGAGAYLAVTQGAVPNQSAMVRLSRADVKQTSRKKKGMLPIVVGKGVCFDTGGHQIKPAKAMMGMHGDMNGSAVALGVFYAWAKSSASPMECYLAIADNAIGAGAYCPGDVVTTLDGTSIEVVHTDAEGRMLLADTLAWVTRHHGAHAAERVVIDFATLTGSMAAAMGNRMSGFFTNQKKFSTMASEVGDEVGERLLAFPLPHDYEAGLKSTIADVLQCRIEGEADHIYAALLLKRFVGELPWVHVDLSSSECSGGLGAVREKVNGFGVNWAMGFLTQIISIGTEIKS